MKTRLLTCLMSLLALAVFSGCAHTADTPAPPDGKLQVAVTFNAMKEFTEAVGQDKVRIVTIIPDGSEPHDFQPTATTLKELSRAKVFVYNGLGMEPWVDKALEVADNKALIVVDASEHVAPIPAPSGHRGRHGVYDPHCWLSLEAAQTEVGNIAKALAKADPDNADFYQKNADAYNGRLQQLLTEYRAKFAAAPHRQFVTGHAAFTYLSRDFNLTQSSVESVFANGEPSPQQLAKLATFCKTYGIHTIFTETMVSPEVSETLAREVGANVQPIHTIESAEGQKTYIDRMRENIENIYASLQ